MKGNESFLPAHHQHQEDGRVSMGLLLNGAGNLVTKDKKKAWIVNAFFASAFTGKEAFSNPSKIWGKVQGEADSSSVEEDQVREHLNKLAIQ